MEGLRWLVCTCAALCVICTVNGATPTLQNCAEYVKEGDNLSCSCRASGCNIQYTIAWSGQETLSAILNIPNVRRELNGTQYTCNLNCGDQSSTVNYTLQVAYGPSEDKTIILGVPFVTYDSRTLTLTCHADVNPSATYTWLDSTCSTKGQGDTCSFVPQVARDDGKVVKCRARNTLTGQQAEKNTTLDLHYPPTEPPVIQGYRTGQILKAGDTLSCTVPGGKPLAQPSFSCSNPELTANGFTKSNTTATTSVTIATELANENDMQCNCSGIWASERDLYTQITSGSFKTEYPTKLTTFTVNGKTDTLSITASEPTPVTFRCEAHGRPAPTITLKRTADYGVETVAEQHGNSSYNTLTHTVQAVTALDMGKYTCIAENGVGFAATATATLNVQSPPRFALSHGAGTSRQTPDNMTEAGVAIQLLSYPVPTTVSFTSYSGPSDASGEAVPLTSNSFAKEISQKSEGSMVVTCRITPRMNMHDKGWLYKATISNGIGSVDYFFRVTGIFTVPEYKLWDTHEETNVGGIVGGVIGGIVALAIIIVAIVVVVKLRKRYRKKASPSSRSRTTIEDTSADDADMNFGLTQDSSPQASVNNDSSPQALVNHAYESSPMTYRRPLQNGYEKTEALNRIHSDYGHTEPLNHADRGYGNRDRVKHAPMSVTADIEQRRDVRPQFDDYSQEEGRPLKLVSSGRLDGEFKTRGSLLEINEPRIFNSPSNQPAPLNFDGRQPRKFNQPQSAYHSNFQPKMLDSPAVSHSSIEPLPSNLSSSSSADSNYRSKEPGRRNPSPTSDYASMDSGPVILSPLGLKSGPNRQKPPRSHHHGNRKPEMWDQSPRTVEASNELQRPRDNPRSPNYYNRDGRPSELSPSSKYPNNQSQSNKWSPHGPHTYAKTEARSNTYEPLQPKIETGRSPHIYQGLDISGSASRHNADSRNRGRTLNISEQTTV